MTTDLGWWSPLLSLEPQLVSELPPWPEMGVSITFQGGPKNTCTCTCAKMLYHVCVVLFQDLNLIIIRCWHTPWVPRVLPQRSISLTHHPPPVPSSGPLVHTSQHQWSTPASPWAWLTTIWQTDEWRNHLHTNHATGSNTTVTFIHKFP